MNSIELPSQKEKEGMSESETEKFYKQLKQIAAALEALPKLNSKQRAPLSEDFIDFAQALGPRMTIALATEDFQTRVSVECEKRPTVKEDYLIELTPEFVKFSLYKMPFHFSNLTKTELRLATCNLISEIYKHPRCLHNEPIKVL